MKTVMFVDDEPQVLRGLERSMELYADDWEMLFSGNGSSVLAELAERRIDAVVTDMRMPGMDGGQLIEQLHQNHPHVARIVLSGQSSLDSTFSAVHPMHQYVSKPCDADVLYASIGRALTLQDLLHDNQVRELCEKLERLPVKPELYEKIRAEMESPNASIRAAGEILAQDVGMASRILQIANSARFGLRREVADAVQAAVILGMKTIRDIVLAAGVAMQYSEVKLRGFSLDEFFDRSLAVAQIAKSIATVEGGDKMTCEQAFTAGLLHDIGQLALIDHSAELYEEALGKCKGDSVSLWDAEQEVFGAAHPSVGAFVLEQWGLPHAVVEAVGFHHCPSQMHHRAMLPVTAVHVAAALERRQYASSRSWEKEIDVDYISKIGCEARLSDWEKLLTGVSD